MGVRQSPTEARLVEHPSKKPFPLFIRAPLSFKKFFVASCQLGSSSLINCEYGKERLDTLYGCSQQAAWLAGALYDDIRYDAGRTAPAGVIADRVIGADFRAGMIAELGSGIIDLLDQGTPPGGIAVIAPVLDRVLEYTLTRQLGEAGYRLQNLTRRRLLSEEPYAQLLVNIASLAMPGAGWPCNTSSLSLCFRTVLGLDPARSALLAGHCFQSGAPGLPALDASGLRARLGFSAGARYDRFKQAGVTVAAGAEAEHLFQRIFSDILAPFVTAPEDIGASRQVIDTAIKFARAPGTFRSYRSVPWSMASSG